MTGQFYNLLSMKVAEIESNKRSIFKVNREPSIKTELCEDEIYNSILL